MLAVIRMTKKDGRGGIVQWIDCVALLCVRWQRVSPPVALLERLVLEVVGSVGS